MNTPTPEQIAKLPKWARDHIETLDSNMKAAQATCARMNEDQKPSPIYVDDWYAKPRIKRYVQSPTGRVIVEHAGVHLEVFLAPEDDGQRMHGIELQYSPLENGKQMFCHADVGVYPRGYDTLFLVHRNNVS